MIVARVEYSAALSRVQKKPRNKTMNEENSTAILGYPKELTALIVRITINYTIYKIQCVSLVRRLLHFCHRVLYTERDHNPLNIVFDAENR